MALSIFVGARGSQFVCDDTAGFGDALAAISRRADAPINSCAREKAAEPLLATIGHMSQPQLYACSLNCKASCHGNCNPANPPGRSTHERRNDGVAYPRWKIGAWLRYWMRGVDVQRDRVAAFCAEARKAGWTVTATYPGSAAESQHVNFRKKPRISLWEYRPLEPGMAGRRVREVVRHLRATQNPRTRRPYLTGRDKLPVHTGYTRSRQKAVEAFQRDHHQKPDGIVGVHTIRALRHAAAAGPRRTSANGVGFVASFEGLRLTAYKADPHEVFWTIGYGHYGPDVKPGMTITKQRAVELLEQDLQRFETAVLRHVPLRWRRHARHFDALVSIAFNVGEEILTPAPPLTSLGVALQGKLAKRIGAAILLYDKGPGGQTLAGLTRRRKDERAVFLHGDYSTA